MRLSNLSIETAQLRNVPRIVREFSSLRVLQSVCSSSNDFGYDKGSFPWGSQFMYPLLLQSKHQVANLEGSGTQSTAVIVTEVLLINSCACKRRVACFFERVDCIFECFICFFFVLCFDSWCVEPYI